MKKKMLICLLFLVGILGGNCFASNFTSSQVLNQVFYDASLGVISSTYNYTEGQILNIVFDDTNDALNVHIDTNSVINASAISVDTTSFSGNLTSADTDVQTSLETIDAISIAGIPGGADTQIQFNDVGVFGGDANFTWNKTNDIMVIIGSTTISGTLDAATVDTGQGDNELYDMDQNVLTTDDVQFAKVTVSTISAADAGGLRIEDDGATVSIFIEDGGNVGIGSSTPQGQLDVTGDLIAFTVNTGQGDNELFDMDQNVLTTSNVTFLNITGTNGLSTTYGISAATGVFSGAVSVATIDTGLGAFEIGQDLQTSDNVTFNELTVSSINASDVSGLSLFDDDDNLGIYIKDGGNVGIGTPNPSTKLHLWIPNNMQSAGVIIQNSDGKLEFVNGTSASNSFAPIYKGHSKGSTKATWLIGNASAGDDSGSSPIFIMDARVNEGAVGTRPTFGFRNDNTAQMTILADGNVGIGTVGPVAKLEVKGTSKFGGTINTNNQWLSGDGDAEGIYIKDDGNIGIGTTNPSAKLEIANSGADDTIAMTDSLDNQDIYLNAGGTSWFVNGIVIGTNTTNVDFEIDGLSSMTPSADVILYSTNTITITDTYMRLVSSGGAVTIGTTPTVADTYDGNYIIFQGTSDTDTITLQDESNLGTSGLQLSGGNDFTLGQGDTLHLIYDSGDDNWYEISRSNN